MFQEKHKVDPEQDFKIISRGGSREVLDIKESIMIGRLRPTLNERVKSAPLFLYEWTRVIGGDSELFGVFLIVIVICSQ